MSHRVTHGERLFLLMSPEHGGWRLAVFDEGKDGHMYDAGKFVELDRMIADAKKNEIQAVVVATPEILGDDYEELVTNLNKIAEAELSLTIVPPSER